MQKLGHFAVDCQEMMPREVQKTLTWSVFLAFSLRTRMVELLGTKPNMQMEVENIIFASGECTE